MSDIGPAIDGAPSLFSVAFDLDSVGYSTDELIATGTASSYLQAGTRSSDSRWSVTRQEGAEFTTRVVVYRPSDAAQANGTVVVEWLNVTGGLDVPAAWMATHRHLIREGYT